LAGNHHQPVSNSDHILALADYLSTGERADPADDEQPQASHPRQLLSIFCSVAAEGQQAPTGYLPLAELRLRRDTIFPKAESPSDHVWQQYDALWGQFRRGIEVLHEVHSKQPDLSSYVESLLLLLQRYTWCIPSAFYRERPDINLYDHSRMTAALAAVLADGPLDRTRLAELLNSPTEAGDEVTLLIGGDISGVQDFIYTITARGATPALRGRSFYLQLLTEACARYVLRELELPITNLIYVGGGNFYLLARPSDSSRLDSIRQHISRVLLQQHSGDLYLSMASQPLQARDFFGGRISGAWGMLTEGFQRAKQQRFAELGSDLELVFVPKGLGGNELRLCQVCGVELAKPVQDEEVRKCPTCLSFEELGDKLRSARYLRWVQRDPADVDRDAPPGEWSQALAALGLEADVYEQLPDAPLDEGIRDTVLALDDEGVKELKPRTRRAVGRRLLVNVTPILTSADVVELEKANCAEDLPRPGKVKPFSAMACQSHGVHRLGVLRMDVDNLGKLFEQGLGGAATLSRIASLSFAVSLYFEGWVSVLAKLIDGRDAKGRDRLYSIYSGGDDLFIVGAWDAVVELALAVRADLTPYAANHAGIHASAGIVLIGGKYPLSQAAQDAGEAEEHAKSLVWWDAAGVEHRKDAICFLGQALPWPRFGLEPTCDGHFETAHGLMHLLVEHALTNAGDGRGAGNALIRRLSSLYEQYAEARDKRRQAGRDVNWSGREQALWGPWMYRAVYTLSQLRAREGDQTAATLRDRLRRDDFRTMEWIGLAARWAELMVR
jgi:CRISPR-associated protein Csm1